MATLNIPRLLIGSTFAGVGKSLLATGVAVALRKRGISVSCCVTSGHALQQASVFRRISRRYTRVLNQRLLNPNQILTTLSQAGIGADLVLIDGTGGVYDGDAPGDARGSDADIALSSCTPVVLVTDVPHYSNSLAALVKGYVQFTTDPCIQAIVGNRVGALQDLDPSHLNPVLAFAHESLRAYALPEPVGGMPTLPFDSPLPPCGVYQGANHTSLPMQFLLDIGTLAARYVDIDRLIKLAQGAMPVEFDSWFPDPVMRRCRFAVSEDLCFSLGYEDNLDLLRYFGAEMVPFSPLLDSRLPSDIGGIYVTGAYLTTYGEELSHNDQMREAIRQFAERGGVVYSEGAGTAYLCRSYQLDRGGRQYPGVGLIPEDAAPVHASPIFFQAETIEDSVLGGVGRSVRGFSSGEWGLQGVAAGSAVQALNTLRIHCADATSYNEGFSALSQSFSTFHFLHFGSQPKIAKSLVEAAAVAL